MIIPEILYQAKRFRIERVVQTTPDGQKHEREIVRHPGAVVILPLLDDGRIVFVRNYRVAVEEYLLELPAGTLDHSPDPRLTAERELAEETGYRAATWEPLITFCMSPGILDEKMHLFLATELTPGKTALEPGEDIQTVLLPGKRPWKWCVRDRYGMQKASSACCITSVLNEDKKPYQGSMPKARNCPTMPPHMPPVWLLSAPIAPIVAINTMPSMTAYSTAVGPSSSARNAATRCRKAFFRAFQRKRASTVYVESFIRVEKHMINIPLHDRRSGRG